MVLVNGRAEHLNTCDSCMPTGDDNMAQSDRAAIGDKLIMHRPVQML